MKARTALLACVACLLAGASGTVADEGVDVTYAGGLLTIRCTEAGLAEVLERIGSATGMELVLDDAIKGTLLTAEIEAQPVQFAVERLLEGRGVSYAMSLSPDGQHVSQMYVGSEAGGKSAASTSAAPSGAPIPGAAANRNHNLLTPPPVPAVMLVPDEDEEVEAGLDDDPSPFAGLAPGALPAIPASALSTAPSAGGQSSVPVPTSLLSMGGPGGETTPANNPVLDSLGGQVPMPQASPSAPPTDQKPASPVSP
jgi:hypothetical protein